jgi:hypothetical protein
MLGDTFNMQHSRPGEQHSTPESEDLEDSMEAVFSIYTIYRNLKSIPKSYSRSAHD